MTGERVEDVAAHLIERLEQQIRRLDETKRRMIEGMAATEFQTVDVVDKAWIERMLTRVLHDEIEHTRRDISALERLRK